jgi:hypothetical protein
MLAGLKMEMQETRLIVIAMSKVYVPRRIQNSSEINKLHKSVHVVVEREHEAHIYIHTFLDFIAKDLGMSTTVFT